MQARRILLFFGIVLLLTAAAASLVPVPEEAQRDREEPPSTEAARPSPEAGPDGRLAAQVEFEASGAPATENVETGERVIVTVEAGEPGEVELQGLGRIQPVEPGTPAVFDLFTDSTGRFEVVYEPVEGPSRAVGTLVVEPARS